MTVVTDSQPSVTFCVNDCRVFRSKTIQDFVSSKRFPHQSSILDEHVPPVKMAAKVVSTAVLLDGCLKQGASNPIAIVPLVVWFIIIIVAI
jgi:hypothetical protein